MIQQNLAKIKPQIPSHVQMVVVTKLRSIDEIKEVYHLGERHFGENRVQDMVAKQEILPQDIRWHLIGHLQTNKVKFIAPFVFLIHSVDSFDLALEINKQAIKHQRIIQILLQIHVAQEDSKFGINPKEVEVVCEKILELPNVEITGIMGMATFTDDQYLIEKEFSLIKGIFDKLKSTHFIDIKNFNTISMGMSDDYKLAIQEGSTMIRLGSIIFQ